MTEPLRTPEDVHAFVEGLVFTDEVVPESQLPPVAAADQDALVPRSFKLPLGLDRGLQALADARKMTKSDLVRQFLEVQYAAEMTAQTGDDELISRADAIRALAAIRPLPRSA